MKINYTTQLDFSNVLLKPKETDIESRKNVSLERTFIFSHSNRKLTCVPIIASNMDTTGTISVAKELIKYKCLTALHKHYPLETIVNFWKFLENTESEDYVFYSLGMLSDDLSKLDNFIKLFGRVPNNLCLDVANGGQLKFIELCKKLRYKYPNIILAAGNVVTPELTEKLIKNGVDFVKCGLGSGSVCETRIVSGVGVPQFSAIIECVPAATGVSGYVMSDGGITTPGCAAKAFGGGAAICMIGGMFAGHDQCEGEYTYDTNGNKIGMKFYGMSSAKSMIKYNGSVAEYRSSEGKEVIVNYKGDINITLKYILGGIRSACTYTNSKTLDELYGNAEFNVVTNTHNKVFGG